MRQRFPSLKSMVKYGLLRSSEEEKVRESWWSPILWSMELLSKEEALYRYGKHHLLERLTDWKKKLSDVTAYSVAPVPLVYTQVVTVAIYFYFAVALVGEQWLIRRQRCLGWSRPDVYKTFIVFSPGTVFGKEMNWISTIQSS